MSAVARLRDLAVSIGGILLMGLFLLLLMFADGVLILLELVMVGYVARFTAWLFG